MNLQIKPMTLYDLESIKNILETEFDDFWSYNVLKSELQNPNSKYLVAFLNSEIVGFGGIWIGVDDIHLTNIVTKKTMRHKGIASKLLESLISISKTKNKDSLTLEVNENNIYAIKLYSKYNFKKIGLRKNYYFQNENAIIMTLFFI